MKNITVKTKVILLAIVGILFISLLLVLLLNKNFDVPYTTDLYSKQTDHAVLNVLENNFMQESSTITYNTPNFKIDSMYFDGIRLYLNMKANFECTADFSIKSNDELFVESVFIPKHETGYMTEDDGYIVVFNFLQGADLSDLRLCYGNQEICNFSLNDSFADKYISEEYFEEMQLNWIQFGETSTLINCKIIANIQGESFQVEQDGTVVSVYVIAHSENDYTFLIPLEMNENSKFTLISNNDKSIELRISVNLDNAVLMV